MSGLPPVNAAVARRFQRAGRGIIPFAVLLAITIVLLWKISLTGQYTWLNSPDIVNQIVPWIQFQAGRWQAGQFPLWDPYHWGGQPLPGQMQPGAMYPLNWILFLAPFKDGHVSYRLLHWYLVVIHFMAASFAYLLCRDLRRSRSASVLGGIAYAFSGFVGTAAWPQMINGAVWSPLVLLFALRSLGGRRPLLNGALSGAFLGIALLSGHHQVPIYTALLVAGLGIYALATRPAQRRQLARATAAFAGFAVLCGAAQVLPAREYGQVALRWVNAVYPVGWQDRVPYPVHDAYSLIPVGVLGIVIPGVHANNVNFDPYVGLTVLLLAMAAAALLWNDATVRALAVAGLCALVFSFGSASAFHGALYALVPGLNKARSPSAAVFAFQLVAAALAAYGLDLLLDHQQRSREVWKRLTGFALGVAAILWTTLFAGEFFLGDKVFGKSWTSTAAFAALMLAALFAAALRSALSRGAVAVCAVALMIFEFSAIVGYPYANREQGWNLVDQLTANQDVIRFIKAQPGPFRVGMDRAVIPFNLGDWAAIEQFDGYNGVTRDIAELSGLPQTHMLFGERYWLGRKPQRTNQELVFSGASGVNVYRNPDAFPRVWSAHAAAVSSDAQIRAWIDRPLDELRSRAVVSGGPSPAVESCTGPDEVRLTGYEDTTVTIEARMACRGLVVLADTFAPGWTATVDDEDATIYRAYGAARAVVVKAGTHHVTFEYSSTAVWLGAAMTLLGLLLLPVAALVDSRIV